MSRVTPPRRPRLRLSNPVRESARSATRTALAAASIRTAIERAVEDEETRIARDLARFPLEDQADPGIAAALRQLPAEWPTWRRTSTARAIAEDRRTIQQDPEP